MSEPIKLSSPETHGFWEIPILYEDDHLLALNKPSGLASCREPGEDSAPTLLSLLHTAIAQGKPWARKRKLTYLMNADQLDIGATGLVLFAKSKSTLEALRNLFGSEKPFKRFIALVDGAPLQQDFVAQGKIGPHPARVGVMRIDSRGGKRARSRFQILERFAGWTLLRCEPLTHQPHQLRVHLQKTGLPLAGDRLYGGAPLLLSKLKRGYRLKPNHIERPLVDRPALHAEQIAFPHPVSSVAMEIRAPWPKDIAIAVRYLRRFVPVPA
jgi:RluA family pseudouridine synthase